MSAACPLVICSLMIMVFTSDDALLPLHPFIILLLYYIKCDVFALPVIMGVFRGCEGGRSQLAWHLVTFLRAHMHMLACVVAWHACVTVH